MYLYRNAKRKFPVRQEHGHRAFVRRDGGGGAARLQNAVQAGQGERTEVCHDGHGNGAGGRPPVCRGVQRARAVHRLPSL